MRYREGEGESSEESVLIDAKHIHFHIKSNKTNHSHKIIY